MADMAISNTAVDVRGAASGDDVSTPCSDYKAHQEYLKLPNTLMGGTKAMRKAGETYLPKEDGETSGKYQARLNRSILFNAYKRTLQKLTGEVFSDGIKYSEDLTDEELIEWLDDIDQCGNDAERFFIRTFLNALNDGVAHVLIDFPPSRATTKEEQVKEGVRPYAVNVKATDLIGWRFDTINGKKVLAQIRIKEKVQMPKGEFGTEDVERIRVIERDSWAVYEKENEQWKIAKDENGEPMEGPYSLGEIPLVTVMFGEPLSDMTAIPPLEDLAYLNLVHWQSSSDQRNILHYARMVTYFGKMLEMESDPNDLSGGSVTLGANKLITSSDPQGDLKVVEHTGAAINSGREDIKDIEAQMALFGLTFMMPKSGNTTATEKAIDTSENASALEGWAKIFEDAGNTVVYYMALWTGKDESLEPGSFKIAKDFASLLGSTDAQTLLQAYDLKLLSREVVFNEFKRRNIIADDYDIVDVVAQLEEDAKAGSPFSGLAGSFLMNQGA